MKTNALLPSLLLLSGAAAAQLPDLTKDRRFGEYWNRGKAELSRFALEESRYGQTRQGDAVLVFVTEDFLTDKQVKHEFGNGPSAKVLKLNFIKKFRTGVYDYSMMASTFTPVDLAEYPHTLKVTTSVQEWCGHVFQQLNLREDGYRLRSFSYFQSEGDESYELPKVMLENEVWTRIRLAPDTLPQGETKMIPGTFDSRLRHRRLQAVTASCKLEETKDGKRYTIDYESLGRSLAIDFQPAFPYRIEAFTETFRRGGRTLRTKGKRTHTRLLAYWRANGKGDADLREELGLR